MKLEISMDKEKFIAAYETALKSAAEEPFQWNNEQKMSIGLPYVLSGLAFGITNTRKFRMWAHTTKNKRSKYFMDISSGLGRRVLLTTLVGTAVLSSISAHSFEVSQQKKKSIKEMMFLQGFDLDTAEAKKLIIGYKFDNAKKTVGLKSKVEETTVQSENKQSTNTVNQNEAEIKLVNLKNPRNWKHWTEIEQDKSEGKSK